MTAHALLARERRRATLWALAVVLPWAALALALLWRDPQAPLRWIAAAAGLIGSAAAAAWAWQAHDARWLARQLDRAPALEDSTGLLLGLEPQASPLAELQRTRIAQRLAALDLRPWLPRRPWWPILAGLLLAAAGIAWLLMRPTLPAAVLEQLPAPLAQVLEAGPPQLRAVHLQVQPPGYTGLPARRIDAADARVPQSSRIDWTVRLGGEVRQAWLEWDDGSRQPLRRDGGTWAASRTLERSALYRIMTEPALPAAQSRLRRIEVIADAPPQVRAIEPEKTLVLRSPGQRGWRVRFLATDDHGVAASAQLRVIQTAGSGENITSSERNLTLNGSGSGRRRVFTHAIDLERSGLTAGNDLIVQLTVRDNRRPRPQLARSASVILRWPPDTAGQAGGLDLLLQRALPAYFRSQRQIIIDAEKLLALKPSLAAGEFGRRSDLLGVDQRALRLRYGQFMGEEAEDDAPLPTSDIDPDHDTHDHDDAHDDTHAHDATPQPSAATAHDGHDHGPPAGGAPLDFAAAAEAAAAELAHTHDIPEAATFFDPQTREMLRAALRAMWSSEGALRGHDPAGALPHAQRALELIKQLQQAERVYLPRLGSELPPVDMGRRLSGKREGLAGRGNAFLARPRADDPLAALWQALAPEHEDAAPELSALAQARATLLARARNEDAALAALAALDALERDPACTGCRADARARLWPLLQPATPVPTPRHAADAGGQAYLDALRREARP